MLYLHAGSLLRVRDHHHPNVGRLLQPCDFSRLHDTLVAGYKVGIDNDGWRGVDMPKYTRMLAKIRRGIFGDLPTMGQLIQHAGYPWPRPANPSEPNPFGEPPPMMPPTPANLLWVVVPDVVANARMTRGSPPLPQTHQRRAHCPGVAFPHLPAAPITQIADAPQSASPQREVTQMSTQKLTLISASITRAIRPLDPAQCTRAPNDRRENTPITKRGEKCQTMPHAERRANAALGDGDANARHALCKN
jgi:hypothetical protein